MKILLISPPVYYPCGPYLAVSSLKAFLDQNGHEALQKDVNIEFFNRILTRAYLEDCYRIIRGKHKEIAGKEIKNEEDRKRYRLFKRAMSLAPYIIKKVDHSRRFFKISASPSLMLSSPVFNVRRLWHLMILRSGLKIIEAAYYPTELSFNHFKMRHSISASFDILKAVEDRNENLFIDFFKRDVLPDIVVEKPGLVGISINDSHQIIPGLTLARLVKNQGFFVVIGGAIFTKEMKIKEEFIDLCHCFVVSEGEHALLDLVKQLEREKNFHNVPNLAWFDDHHKGLVINQSSYVEDLDLLPAPDFNGLFLDHYFKFYKKDISLPMAVSKGCYWNRCAFCAITAKKEYKIRRVSLVMGDLREVVIRYRVKSFIFTGEALSPEYLRELSEALIEEGMDIKWMAYARFEDEFTESFCRLLARAGCEKVLIGLESGSQRILDLMNKGTRLTHIKKVLSHFHKAGMATHLFVLVGFPTETTEEAQETLKFLLDNRKSLDCPDFTLKIEVVYYHGASDLFRFPKRYGIEKIKIKNIEDDLEIRGKYMFDNPQGVSVLETKKMIDRWYDLMHKEYYYYGFQHIILNEEIAERFRLKFIILLLKLTGHFLSFKINALRPHRADQGSGGTIAYAQS
jgi:radical SAM superfamily enzyme YgiQ (UPF0313 family)